MITHWILHIQPYPPAILTTIPQPLSSALTHTHSASYTTQDQSLNLSQLIPLTPLTLLLNPLNNHPLNSAHTAIATCNPHNNPSTSLKCTHTYTFNILNPLNLSYNNLSTHLSSVLNQQELEPLVDSKAKNELWPAAWRLNHQGHEPSEFRVID